MPSVFWEDFFRNRRVYLLATIAYCGCLVFGYDTGVAGSVIALQSFQTDFNMTGSTQRINDLKSNVVSVLQAGAFFGSIFAAPITDRTGRRWAIFIFALIFIIGGSLQVAATSQLSYIYAGRTIAGLGVGGLSALTPTYVSECSPKEVRGRITGLFQFFIAIGVALSYWCTYGVQVAFASNTAQWRIPLGVQLIPGGILLLGIFLVPESPRWLARKGRLEECLKNLAYYRSLPRDHPDVVNEMLEIEATIEEEKKIRAGLSLREAYLAPGNRIRFVIAIVIMVLQQFSGQNTIGYYAPTIFQAIGYSSTTSQIFASGIYGIMKVVATGAFLLVGIEQAGRRASLFWGALGMGLFMYIIGAILKTHPPQVGSDVVAPASKASAAMIYLFAVVYSFSLGPVPWIYVSDIFPTRTRHVGLATASASQWLFNFVVSKISPQMETNLGWQLFMVFATINVGGMATFAYFLPETKGRSLEEMDIIFGAVKAEERAQNIQQAHVVVDRIEGGPAGATHPHVTKHQDPYEPSGSEGKGEYEHKD